MAVSALAAPAGTSVVAAQRPLLAEALDDLCSDFDELLHLCRSADAKLEGAALELTAASLLEPTRELLLCELARSRRRYQATAQSLRVLGERARRDASSSALVAELTAERALLADLLRTEQALLGGLVGAGDWQSPSFAHSLRPAAGRQAGRVRPHWNDYKRDRHLDADTYERLYRRELVDGPPGLRALLTSCGMSAFTTIVSFLRCERKLDGPVLAGSGLYHETRLLLERVLHDRLLLVDERDPHTLSRAIDGLAPSAIFLDSLSNTTWMPVPDLQAVIERLRGTDIYLVVDNTGLSLGCQPFALADESVRLLVFESLLKYAQLGLDRVNAGVIVARAADAELLADYREHLGTNISDLAVHALPRPDRRVLGRRLARLERNALVLAARLEERAPASVEIVYPGLRAHPCAHTAAGLPFRGGCLSIVLAENGGDLAREYAFIEAAVAEASRRGVALHAGSSFGFDTTRVYLTAARAACGEPFLRVAAGTEHRLALDPLAEALQAALASVAR